MGSSISSLPNGLGSASINGIKNLASQGTQIDDCILATNVD